MAEERGAPDPRISELMAKQSHLHDCVEALKAEMKKNTEVTEQVRDILATFRISMVVAKWIAAIAAAGGACVAFLRSVKGG